MQLLIPGYYFSLSSVAVGTALAFLFFPIIFRSAFCLYEEGKVAQGLGLGALRSLYTVYNTLGLYYSLLWPSIPWLPNHVQIM